MARPDESVVDQLAVFSWNVDNLRGLELHDLSAAVAAEAGRDEDSEGIVSCIHGIQENAKIVPGRAVDLKAFLGLIWFERLSNQNAVVFHPLKWQANGINRPVRAAGTRIALDVIESNGHPQRACRGQGINANVNDEIVDEVLHVGGLITFLLRLQDRLNLLLHISAKMVWEVVNVSLGIKSTTAAWADHRVLAKGVDQGNG